MSTINYKGKDYELPENPSLTAMASMGICTFRYYPKDRIIINSKGATEQYSCKQIYENMPYDFIEDKVCEKFKEDCIKMYNAIHLGAKKASTTFMIKNSRKGCKVTLSPIKYDEDGELEIVLGVIENADDLFQDSLETKKQKSDLIKNLSNIFFSMHYIDLVTNTFEEVYARESMHAVLGSKGNARSTLKKAVEVLVLEEYKPIMRKFHDFDTIAERMEHKDSITQDYMGVTNGWARGTMVVTERDSKGHATKVLYVLREIRTEKVAQLEVQEKLKQAEYGYRILHKLIKSGMWSMDYDENGIRTRVNWSDEFRRMIGYEDCNEFPNTLEAWATLLHPEDWETGFDRIDAAVYDKTGKTIYDQEFRLKTKNRGYRWFRATGDVLRKKDGSPIRFYGVFFDITDQKERAALEQQVNKSLEELKRHQDALYNIHGVLGSGPWSMEFDEKGQMESCFWSTSFKRMLGYSKEDEFPNQLATWSNLLHEEDKEEALNSYWDAVNDYTGQTNYDVECRVLTKDRGYRWFHTAGKLSRREDGSPITFVGVFIDIDEKKKAEYALKEQQKLLQEALVEARHANEAKTMFLNNVSHDIRTPMNAIIGFTSLALKHIDNKEQVYDYLDKIHTSSNHLLLLINDVLDMSRIESGKVVIEKNKTNLTQLIKDLQSIIQTDVHSKQLQFSMDIDSIKNENIVCDKLRLNQILLNLLSNAIKFTNEGGKVSLVVHQKESMLEGYNFYEFKIIDTGIGMSKEFQKNVFYPFERERTSTVSGIQGTGLGMAITKNLVDMMGGTIAVDSKPNEGSTFTVSLLFKLCNDVVEPNESTTSCEDTLANQEEPSFEGKRILLVEDNKLNQEIAVEILKEAGFILDVADDGIFAVEKVKNSVPGQYDLILMDIQMPNLDGYGATKQIRALENPKLAKIPIVAMTANAFEEDRQKVIEVGMNEHIGKPIDVNKLKKVLAKILSAERK
jgi:PAS domain S-box-containing protein